MWIVDGERLKKLRIEQVLTQKELAEAAKVTERTIRALEHGDASAHPSTIRKLAAVLGVTPRDLIRTEDQSAL